MSFLISEAYVDLSLKGLDTVKQGLGGLKGMLSQLGITPATLGIVGIGGAIAYAVKKAMDWEQHTAEMKSKLSAMGENADEAAGKINNLAKAISKTTNETAGHVKELVMQAMNMGASSAEAQQLAAQAIGMGKATGQGAEEVLTGLVKIQHGMRSSLDKSIPAMAEAGTQREKLALAVKLSAQGYKQFAGESGTAENQMDQLSKRISSLYNDLGKQFLPAIHAVINAFQGMMDWVEAVIDTIKDLTATTGEAGTGFNDTWKQVTDFFGQCAAYIGKICFWIVKQFMLIPAYGELIGVSIMNLFMNLIPAYLKAFGANFVILCKFIWDNWRDIFATIWNYVKAGFNNTIDNIKNLWTALLGFFKGKGFHVEWKGLTEGAVSEMKKMPQFVKVATDPIWDRMQKEALDKVNKQGAAIDAAWEKNKPSPEKKHKQEEENKKTVFNAIKDGLKPHENLKDKDKSSKGMVGVLDIWRNAQQQLMKGNTEKEHLNISKQQLAEQKETNRLQRMQLEKHGGNHFALAK